MTAGYSATPLSKKLGIKPGSTVAAINAPADYRDLVEPLPPGVTLTSEPSAGVEIIHFFANGRDELARGLAEYRNVIRLDGAIWVSWYKRAAKLPTEITEDVVRDLALPLGLVDVKVCAVDASWSGLKLVIRRENRI